MGQVGGIRSLQGIRGRSRERIPEKDAMTDSARELCMGEMKEICEKEIIELTV